MNQPANAFSKAEDRFKVTSFNTPSPGIYSPKHNLNENINSEFKY